MDIIRCHYYLFFLLSITSLFLSKELAMFESFLKRNEPKDKKGEFSFVWRYNLVS